MSPPADGINPGNRAISWLPSLCPERSLDVTIKDDELSIVVLFMDLHETMYNL